MKIEVRIDHLNVPVGVPNVVHVLLTVTAPELPSGKNRPELNLAAVIDRSGSMQGQKIDFAKKSVRLLLEQLGPKDRFSLVTFDETVTPLVEGVRVSDKTRIGELVERIVVGGTTNLSGGWLKGIELVGRESAAEHVNAVLLLTDGRANVGVTAPDQLAALGESVHREKAIRTSCLGIGADFDEDLLKNISSAAGGRFYYIETPDQTPEVFKEELGGLLDVVAQNVEVVLDLSDGVLGIVQLTGHLWKQEKSVCHVLLGDFNAQQVKHLLLAVQLPAVSDVTDVHLAALRLTYAEMLGGAVDLKSQKQGLIIRAVRAQEAAQPGDPEVLLHIGLQRAAQARKDAVSQLDMGNVARATQVLEASRDQLRSMAAQSSMPHSLEEEAKELDRRAAELRTTQDVGTSRKFMVAEGTHMSRTDYARSRTSRIRHEGASSPLGPPKTIRLRPLTKPEQEPPAQPPPTENSPPNAPT